MTRSNSRLPQNNLLLWLAVTAATLAGSTAVGEEKADNAQAKASAITRLTNGDIEWDSLGAHGGPRLTGKNAISAWKGDVGQSPNLLKRLDDDGAFEAAHVLLTSLWRVPQKKKNSFSHPLSDGFFVCHNGLHVRITWEFVAGEVKKTVDIPDLSCQRKRIRKFWNARFRDYPDEFSPDTKVE